MSEAGKVCLHRLVSDWLLEMRIEVISEYNEKAAKAIPYNEETLQLKTLMAHFPIQYPKGNITKQEARKFYREKHRERANDWRQVEKEEFLVMTLFLTDIMYGMRLDIKKSLRIDP